MLIIAGLGNPGRRYEKTRHNVGFMALDVLSKNLNIPLERLKFQSLYGEGKMQGEKIILIKPQTYMNRSGNSLRQWMQFYKLPAKNLLVIHDDIDLPFGDLRIRAKGGPGTHNGLRSIVEQIGSEDFPRIKIGVGMPVEKKDLAEYVLAEFMKDEWKEIEKIVSLAAEAAEAILKEDVDFAMNRYNGKAR